MAKVEIDLDLLVKISEIAASALNDTVSHQVIKSDTNATDGDIEAAAFLFLHYSNRVVDSDIPESVEEFNELILQLKQDKEHLIEEQIMSEE